METKREKMSTVTSVIMGIMLVAALTLAIWAFIVADNNKGKIDDIEKEGFSKTVAEKVTKKHHLSDHGEKVTLPLTKTHTKSDQSMVTATMTTHGGSTTVLPVVENTSTSVTVQLSDIKHNEVAILNLDPHASYTGGNVSETSTNLPVFGFYDVNAYGYIVIGKSSGGYKLVEPWTNFPIKDRALSVHGDINGKVGAAIIGTDHRILFRTITYDGTVGTEYTIDAASTTNLQVNLHKQNNGYPAVVYIDTGNNLIYEAATNVDGTVWGTPYNISAVGAATALSVTQISGVPIVAYVVSNVAYVNCAKEVNPDAAADWNGATTAVASNCAATHIKVLPFKHHDGETYIGLVYKDSSDNKFKFTYNNNGKFVVGAQTLTWPSTASVTFPFHAEDDNTSNYFDAAVLDDGRIAVYAVSESTNYIVQYIVHWDGTSIKFTAGRNITTGHANDANAKAQLHVGSLSDKPLVAYHDTSADHYVYFVGDNGEFDITATIHATVITPE